MGVVEIIGKQGRAFQVSLGLILLVLVGTGGLFATSSLLEFSVFFIIPVAYFTWFIHRKAGTLASVVSAVVTLCANIGSPLHVGHPAVAYWNALIWLGFFISITFVVAALKFLHDRERQLSHLDSLTGIANRLGFYEYANGERKRAGRSKQPITLAYLDLDGFKEINDTLGHQTGDKVLVSVARTMQMSVRQTDMVGRMGGDEFALILPDTSKAAANTVLRKVSWMLECGMKQNGWRITFSPRRSDFPGSAGVSAGNHRRCGSGYVCRQEQWQKPVTARSAGLLQPKCHYSRGFPRRTLTSQFVITRDHELTWAWKKMHPSLIPSNSLRLEE
jgi:diguanylate cyclase (GGDEF)-like protein